jgi:hypothetical protein
MPILSITDVGKQSGVKVHPLDVHEVDCRRCPEQGCCGKKRVAVPGDLYSRLLQVKEALEMKEGAKIPMCRVINLFSDVLCPALGKIPRRPLKIKQFEEMISRDIMYKARYTLGRLMDAPDPRLAWTFVELGLRDWFIAIHRLMNAQPRLDSIEYVEDFLEKLNIKNRYMFAWAIRNLLNMPSVVKVIRRDDKSKYAMDIIAFQLWYVKDNCPGWTWGEVVSANNHLPTLLIILWRYLNDCVKPKLLREIEEQRKRQQQVRPAYTAQSGYSYYNYNPSYYNTGNNLTGYNTGL